MKNVLKVWFSLSAALVVLGACQRETLTGDEIKTKDVNAQFVFNISSTMSSRTKQSAAETQATSEQTFRGISQAFLLTLKQGSDGKILAADQDATRKYDLSSVVAAGDINATNSRRIIEMSLPLQTNTLLFYGRATKGTYQDFDRDDCFGKVDDYTIEINSGSACFAAGKRLQNTAEAKYKDHFYTIEKLIAGILTIVMNSDLTSDEDHKTISATGKPDGCDVPYNFTLSGSSNVFADGGYPRIKWSDYAKKTNGKYMSPVDPTKEQYPLEEKMRNLYEQMTSLRTLDSKYGAELRAGSSDAIEKTVQDMWSVLNSVRCAGPVSAPEAVAKYFAAVIDSKLKQYFTATVTGDGSPVTLTKFRSISSVVTSFNTDSAKVNATYRPSDVALTAIKSIDDGYLSDFPYKFNLPRGGTHVRFDTEKLAYYYPTGFDTSAMGGTPAVGSEYTAESYFYPAELLYFGNSPVRTSEKEHTTTEYPNGAHSNDNGWDNEASWGTDWTGTQVMSSTRSVAMKYDINYGVALLETKVAYDVLTLNDNNHLMQQTLYGTNEADRQIKISESSYFKLTGVIIGGQPKNVGWDYLPVADTSLATPKKVTGFIYDKAVHAASQTIPAAVNTPSQPNYTLVFDNFSGELGNDGIYTPASAQEKVYVALEFQNKTGKDFYGNANLIKADGYFYLIGELDPAQGSAPVWPTGGYVIPPYTAEGTSQQVRRVFIQDFMTSVTFKLGVNSLKYAYFTVPDLRSSSLSLGLSVDMKWETGINYSDVILGGN